MPTYRSASASVLVGSLALGAGLTIALTVALAAPAAAGSGDGDVQASMQCDRASEPGRVRCVVEARVSGGHTIAWADVEILALPDFASALKGRIGPQDALSRDATTTKWALGLVARRGGQGDVRARVRVVACEASPDPRSDAGAPPPDAATSGETRTRCTPVIVEVKAQVTVG